MENTNISAVSTAQTTNANTGKHKWLTKGSKFAKKSNDDAHNRRLYGYDVFHNGIRSNRCCRYKQLYHNSLHSPQIRHLSYRWRCRSLGRCQPPRRLWQRQSGCEIPIVI